MNDNGSTVKSLKDKEYHNYKKTFQILYFIHMWFYLPKSFYNTLYIKKLENFNNIEEEK
jgi:hypothetical protein